MKKLVLHKTTSLALKDKKYKINYADELNTAQYEAVMHSNGAALVIAGAGTGKTRTLIFRLARLIEDGIPPKAILLLTFTRKSASEMLRRASILLDGRCQEVSGGTFHSFAHQQLRRYAVLLGFESNFTVLDQSDAEDVLNLLRGQIIGTETKRRFPRKQTLMSLYSASVNCCQKLEESVKKITPQYLEEFPDIERLMQAYIGYKRKHNLMDYDDLLVHFLNLLQNFPDVLSAFHRNYRYIMADEYQDTNLLQHSIILALAGDSQNVMAVGDDAQSIYSFRGANFQNIMTFPDSYKNCKIIALEQNYRSTSPILHLTNEIIARAAFRYEKNLYSHVIGGEPPAIICTDDERQQSTFIAQRILELREQGIPLEEISVLFRSGFHSFDLEIELRRSNIPFRKFGGFKFIETAHIKDIISFLRVIANPKDAVSWNRILLLMEGIGPKSAGKVIEAITEGKVTIWLPDNLNGILRSPEPVTRLFGTLRNSAGENQPVDERVAKIIEFYRPLMKKKYDDYPKRLKDIEVFQTIADRYRSLQSLLSDMALDPPTESITDIERTDKEEEYLTLSTIHSAKGLEWNSVFVIWALDGRFPPVKAFENLDTLEEERRLMYVACTRAKENLIITYPTNIFDRETGSVLGTPSRFIEGMSEEIADFYVIALEEGE